MAGIALAYADRTNRLRVELTEAAAILGLGAATSAANWTVEEALSSAPVPIAKIEQGESRAVWLLTVQGLLAAGVAYVVTASEDLETSAGGSFDDPDFAGFVGVGAAGIPAAAARRQAGLDFALPTLGDPARGIVGGAYRVTAAGDYALEAGAEARASDYLRRLLTKRGGFVHLPGYGVSLAPKQLVSGAALLRIQRDVQAQISAEPGVVAVAPRLEAIGSGVVVCSVRVRTADGGELTAAAKLGGAAAA